MQKGKEGFNVISATCTGLFPMPNFQRFLLLYSILSLFETMAMTVSLEKPQTPFTSLKQNLMLIIDISVYVGMQVT